MGNVCKTQVGHDIQIKYGQQFFFVTNQNNDTILDLKKKMSKGRNISTNNIVLKLNNRTLNDSQKLQTNGYQFNLDHLVMEIQQNNTNNKSSIKNNNIPQIKICIRSINFTQHIQINPKSKICDLKQKIQENKNLPTRKQRLIFASTVLKDNQQILSCGIKEDSVVYLATVLIE